MKNIRTKGFSLEKLSPQATDEGKSCTHCCTAFRYFRTNPHPPHIRSAPFRAPFVCFADIFPAIGEINPQGKALGAARDLKEILGSA